MSVFNKCFATEIGLMAYIHEGKL